MNGENLVFQHHKLTEKMAYLGFYIQAHW